MKRRLLITPRANRDIDEHFEYIANDDPRSAARFLDALFKTLADLRTQPFKGVARSFSRSDLADLRVWFVQGFSKHLVFYKVTDRSLVVVRILHSSRDLDRIFKR